MLFKRVKRMVMEMVDTIGNEEMMDICRQEREWFYYEKYVHLFIHTVLK